MSKILSMDEFDKRYDQDRVASVHGRSDGIMETYGKDLEEVLKIHEQDPRRVWTCMDSEDCDGIIYVPGLHYVGRVYYVITKQRWKSSKEIYLQKLGE